MPFSSVEVGDSHTVTFSNKEDCTKAAAHAKKHGKLGAIVTIVPCWRTKK